MRAVVEGHVDVLRLRQERLQRARVPQPTAAYATSGTARVPGRSAASTSSSARGGIAPAARSAVHSPIEWPATIAGRTPSPASA